MTKMLASVRNREEALLAQAAGADLIDMKEPGAGAPGALPAPLVAKIVASLHGKNATSAFIGDLPMEPGVLLAEAQAMAKTGVDYVKIGFFPSSASAQCIAALAPLAAKQKCIAVLFADLQPDWSLLEKLAKAGFHGAMLDTASKTSGRLLNHLDIGDINAFVTQCHANGLICGLAGGLEPPDVPRLLLAEPDYLGFRGALCVHGERRGDMDESRLRLIRELIPVRSHASAGAARRNWRLLAARGHSRDDVQAEAKTDRVFVHDYVVRAHIGAYNYEHDIEQKVRFNVDVEITRMSPGTDDMREVFSYDIIIDAIALILKQGHIALVETLVEELAQTLLRHPRVVAAHVQAEKLDIINGSVGVAIERRRAAGQTAVKGLFPQAEEGRS
ncbi:MAG: dihydroneopterin aldolase [Hyphomicrobiales bacterium]|nr:dihydroneopterin aldolase [Hyphomicrobiales bacterium]MDE2115304.1 dihydroneopterin aldolase [Hyphomicrobiales bacterium]